ncbi:MAG: hypothetical protein BWX60_00454 [Candidatus Marinimicrobia bacterium ADurb.Bin030]|nr:MAG: hypothetical protein BWX60_00454 [Candidatus Marinimicrobia bacterium ADurb.Bin030]
MLLQNSTKSFYANGGTGDINWDADGHHLFQADAHKVGVDNLFGKRVELNIAYNAFVTFFINIKVVNTGAGAEGFL